MQLSKLLSKHSADAANIQKTNSVNLYATVPLVLKLNSHE
jgi:hypothetical protein